MAWVARGEGAIKIAPSSLAACCRLLVSHAVCCLDTLPPAACHPAYPAYPAAVPGIAPSSGAMARGTHAALLSQHRLDVGARVMRALPVEIVEAEMEAEMEAGALACGAVFSRAACAC